MDLFNGFDERRDLKEEKGERKQFYMEESLDLSNVMT
jgi:hypothetical protein